MAAPDISVIIPAFNAERYLAEAIDSVLAQTLQPAEIIVIDDGSTDRTAEIAAAYGSRVACIRQANAGTAEARNAGLRAATGAYLAFLDADDRYHPDRLRRQREMFDADTSLDMVICQAQDFWTPELPPPAGWKTPAPQFRGGQAQTWLVRRSLFDRIGGFPGNKEADLTEGSAWYLEASNSGARISLLEVCLVERRLHDANKTTNREQHLLAIARLMKRKIDTRRKGQ